MLRRPFSQGALPTFDIPDTYKRKGRRASVSAESDVQQTAYVPKKVPKTVEAAGRIRAAVSGSFLFSGLDKDQLTEIVDAMEEKKAEEGEVIIREGMYRHGLGSELPFLSNHPLDLLNDVCRRCWRLLLRDRVWYVRSFQDCGRRI